MKMDEGKRVIEIVRDIAEFIPLVGGRKMTAAQLLERFLFSKDAQWKHVSVLSGGEKKAFVFAYHFDEKSKFFDPR